MKQGSRSCLSLSVWIISSTECGGKKLVDQVKKSDTTVFEVIRCTRAHVHQLLYANRNYLLSTFRNSSGF